MCIRAWQSLPTNRPPPGASAVPRGLHRVGLVMMPWKVGAAAAAMLTDPAVQRTIVRRMTSYKLCNSLRTCRRKGASDAGIDSGKESTKEEPPRGFAKLHGTIGGGGGIRTHESLRPSGFQDRRLRPLGHPSVLAGRQLSGGSRLVERRLLQVLLRSPRDSLPDSLGFPRHHAIAEPCVALHPLRRILPSSCGARRGFTCEASAPRVAPKARAWDNARRHAESPWIDPRRRPCLGSGSDVRDDGPGRGSRRSRGRAPPGSRFDRN